MLSSSRVEANIPAGDLARARAFYEGTLGLEPVRVHDSGQVAYRTSGGTTVNLYQTQYAGQAGHTIAQWHVDDLAAQVGELKRRGVEFHVYDLPGIAWDGEIATLPDVGRAAWFSDTEGNIMCIDQAL